MGDSKYSKFLTILLIVVGVGIVILLGYLGFNFIKKVKTDTDAEKFIEQYENEISQSNDDTTGNNEEEQSIENPLDRVDRTGGQSGETRKRIQYKGFDVSGTIEIPKTSIKYPILTSVSKKGLETSVCIQYKNPANIDVNQPGNVVIVGHNYRNGSFFSNNNKLGTGDTIYITNNSGEKLKYEIYSKYETTPEDTEYMARDTAGKREISLSTCTNDSSKRIIILAVAEEDK